MRMRRSAMAADEAIHEEVVRGLAARGRNRLSGTFRAAVFGANDGLVSNLSLVLGVTAAGLSPGGVLATGVAGLLAGALSMGAGEYVSVHSQRELLEASTPESRRRERGVAAGCRRQRARAGVPRSRHEQEGGRRPRGRGARRARIQPAHRRRGRASSTPVLPRLTTTRRSAPGSARRHPASVSSRAARSSR